MYKLVSLLFGFLILTSLLLFPQRIYASALQWQKTFDLSENGTTGTSITVSLSNPNVALASVRQRFGFDLLKSTDYGQSWVSVKTNLPVNAADPNWISIYKQDSNVIAISLWGAGTYLSENGGLSWTRINEEPYPRSVAINPLDKQIIFAGIGGNQTNSGVYRTSDKGMHWQKMPIGNANNSQMAIDQTNGMKVYADIDPLYFRSLDGGNTWVKMVTDQVSNTELREVFADTQIDVNNSSVVYAGRYNGIYRTTDDGENWIILSNSVGKGPYRLGQDNDGTLFMSSVQHSGGVWRSTDGGDNWENVADPDWGTRNTWGLDVGGGRIYVSVDGLGIYIANTDGSPISPPKHKACQNNACMLVDGAGSDTCQSDQECVPPTHMACVNYACTIVDGTGNNECQSNQDCIPPGPDPVVVVPGFGASLSPEAFFLHDENTTYKNWTMMPFIAPETYNPFLDTLHTLGFVKDQDLFFFAYDFTRSISQTAYWLDDYLTQEVLPKNPGKKADIVAHSMGGLITRFCVEHVFGCKDKIDKIVSAGSPHRGTVWAYYPWEGADFSPVVLDPIQRYAIRFLLRTYGLPKWDELEIIQTKIKGLQDLLPIQDYIWGKPYGWLSLLGQNMILNLLPLAEFPAKTLALSGEQPNSTPSLLVVSPPSRKQVLEGYWVDGQPRILENQEGDGTVLKSSADIFGILEHKSYNIDHSSYLNTLIPVNDILQFLGLPTVSSLPVTSTTGSVTVYYSTDPNLEIKVGVTGGETISQPSSYSVFILNGKPAKRSLTVYARRPGNYTINTWYSNARGQDIEATPASMTLGAGEKKNFEL